MEVAVAVRLATTHPACSSKARSLKASPRLRPRPRLTTRAWTPTKNPPRFLRPIKPSLPSSRYSGGAHHRRNREEEEALERHLRLRWRAKIGVAGRGRCMTRNGRNGEGA